MRGVPALEFAAALAASAGGCWLITRLVRPRPGTLVPQLVRTAGRALWVLMLVTLGIGVLGRTPWAITVGTLVGWAAAGLWSEALGVPRRGVRE